MGLLALYVVAFVAQVVGAAGVIKDVVVGVRNMRAFKTDLAAAQLKAEEHREVMNRTTNEFVRAQNPAARES